MVTYVGPDRSYTAGVPTQSSDNFAVTPEGLITGDVPAQFTVDIPTAPSQTLAAYTVVGVNASGQVIPAVAGTTQAIGILLYPVTTAAGETNVARVLRAGCINALWSGLVWNASYNTNALKMNAFNGAPSPTQFVTRRLAHGTFVTP